MDPCRILVMASGNGSNFQALIDAVSSHRIPGTIVGLIVNRAKAFATSRADAAHIPYQRFNLITDGFLTKGETDPERVSQARRRYDGALAEKVLGMSPRPELIVLAGWMHVFSKEFLEPLERAGVRVMNLHPALPGAYDGAGAIERAFQDFQAGRASKTGIMVHYVIVDVDRGAPIMVQEIEWHGEDLPQLEERMHECEHELIVKATAKVSDEIMRSRQVPPE